MLARSSKVLLGLFLFLYPVCVYGMIRTFGIDISSVLILVLLALRWSLTRGKTPLGKIYDKILIVVMLFIGLNFYFGRESLLRLYPAFMSLGVGLVFGRSLFVGTPLVEVFASLNKPSLTTLERKYTRIWTSIWAVALLVNGVFSLFTAFYTTVEFWAYYNGFLFYVLAGSLFGLEFLIRYTWLNRKGSHV